jgi:hypothetical protein
MTTPSEKPLRQEPRAPSSWIEWYRFARRKLELTRLEAQSYATARLVEDENRRHRAHGGSS